MTSYVLKFTLDGSKPSVTRTLSVPKESSFYDLHRNIQDSMGWTDIHLHEFIAGKKRVMIGPSVLTDVKDEREIPISEYEGEPIHYNYDFGDRLEVTISWEGENDGIIPEVRDFQEVSPVDDSGGVLGFQMMQKILKDPKNPDYEDTKKWMENYPPRTREYAEFAVATYVVSGVRNGRKAVKPELIGAMSQMFALPSSGEVYLDIENSKVCELVESVKQKSRFTKVTRNVLESDPERFVKITFSYDALDKKAESMAAQFEVVKDRTIRDENDVITLSTEDKTEWMMYSITYYIKDILDEYGLYIDYGYNGYNPVELSFRQIQNDPAAMEKMLNQFRDKAQND